MNFKNFLTILVFISISCGFLQTARAQDYACKERKIPQLVDIVGKTGIKFTHTSAPEKKYIVESMSGGVLLVDYDRDGWLDVYLTNAPTVEMALKRPDLGKPFRSYLKTLKL